MKYKKMAVLLCTGTLLVAGCSNGNSDSPKTSVAKPKATVTQEVPIEDQELVVPYACQNLAIFVGATKRLTGQAADFTEDYRSLIREAYWAGRKNDERKADRILARMSSVDEALQGVYNDLTHRIKMSEMDKVHCLEAGEALEGGMDPHGDAGEAGEGHEDED